MPVVAAEPTVGQAPVNFAETQPVWSADATELLAAGERLAKTAEVAANGQALTLRGDASAFGDQFQSPIISVDKHTDYAFTFSGKVVRGEMGVKITDASRRVTLTSLIFAEDEKTGQNPVAESAAPASAQQTRTLFFASGNRSDVRMVISNDRAESARPEIQLTKVQLINLGQTPYLWTRYPRLLVRGVQKNLFQTKILLPLVVVGVLLLMWARRFQVLIFLLTVPAYYLLIHSTLSTEYRYILAIHYCFFVIAAITLCGIGLATKQAGRFAINRFKNLRPSS